MYLEPHSFEDPEGDGEYMYIYVCMYVCMYIYIEIYIEIYVCEYVYACIGLYKFSRDLSNEDMSLQSRSISRRLAM